MIAADGKAPGSTDHLRLLISDPKLAPTQLQLRESREERERKEWGRPIDECTFTPSLSCSPRPSSLRLASLPFNFQPEERSRSRCLDRFRSGQKSYTTSAQCQSHNRAFSVTANQSRCGCRLPVLSVSVCALLCVTAPNHFTARPRCAPFLTL